MTKKQILKDCINHKPTDLSITNVHWKGIIYTALYGKMLMITGPTGAGKTFAINKLKNFFDGKTNEYQQFIKIPMGSSQDAKSTLIGNTHLDKDGTTFKQSAFIKAIQTENANILLDEINRGDIQGLNILMSILDPEMKFVRLDDDINTPDIPVADGVSIFATANIGREYTATNLIDKAHKGRFSTFKLSFLPIEDEIKIQKIKHPNVNENVILKLCKLADYTRNQYIDGNMTDYIQSKFITWALDKFDTDAFTIEEVIQLELLEQLTNPDDLQLIKQYQIAHE